MSAPVKETGSDDERMLQCLPRPESGHPQSTVYIEGDTRNIAGVI